MSDVKGDQRNMTVSTDTAQAKEITVQAKEGTAQLQDKKAREEIQRRGLSKNSTFEEAYEYLQSFRPTDDEKAGWLDGTHAYHYPQGLLEGQTPTLFHWHDDTSGEYPKGLAKNQIPTLTQFTDERSGRFIAHREGGKPAVVHYLDQMHFGMESWITAKFFENGRRRSGGKPWRVELNMRGEVTALLFCGEDAGGYSKGRHRMDGPTSIVRKSYDVIEFTYAIMGEVVEKVQIRRGKA